MVIRRLKLHYWSLRLKMICKCTNTRSKKCLRGHIKIDHRENKWIKIMQLSFWMANQTLNRDKRRISALSMTLLDSHGWHQVSVFLKLQLIWRYQKKMPSTRQEFIHPSLFATKIQNLIWFMKDNTPRVFLRNAKN